MVNRLDVGMQTKDMGCCIVGSTPQCRYKVVQPRDLTDLHQESFGSRGPAHNGETTPHFCAISTTCRSNDCGRPKRALRVSTRRKQTDVCPSPTRPQRITHFHDFRAAVVYWLASTSREPMVFVCPVDPSPIWGYLYAKDRISIAQGLGGSLGRSSSVHRRFCPDDHTISVG
jgi:hypothetical protein